MKAAYLKTKFDAGLAYAEYVATGKPDKQDAWAQIYEQAALTDHQRRVVEGFTREMHIICVSGVWCGDCVQQGPLLQRIAEANPQCVKLVWLDRDEHLDLAEQIMINAGLRVPVAVFCAEDDELVSIFGDRTLARYRAMASKVIGAHCRVPGAPAADDEVAETLQDWLDEFERVHLLLRTSGRLRQKHGD